MRRLIDPIRVGVLAVVVMGMAWGAVGRAQTVATGQKLFVAPYFGWREGLYLNSPETKIKAVVVPAIGGRVVTYGANEENILYVDPTAHGKTLAISKDFLASGYQCDVGPEFDGIPPHDLIWKGEWKWTSSGPYSIEAESEIDPALGLRLSKKFLFDSDSGDLGIDQTMINATNHETEYCLWDRTVCRNGGIVFFPLNSRSHYKSHWALCHDDHGHNIYDGANPKLDQVRVVDGVLFCETRGAATKIGADTAAGWVAYVRGDLLFVKYFPVEPKGNYGDGGNNLEVYFDQATAELEPMSPKVKLQPGEKYTFPEMWSLTYLEKDVDTIDQARKLVRQISPSPFRH